MVVQDVFLFVHFQPPQVSFLYTVASQSAMTFGTASTLKISSTACLWSILERSPRAQKVFFYRLPQNLYDLVASLRIVRGVAEHWDLGQGKYSFFPTIMKQRIFTNIHIHVPLSVEISVLLLVLILPTEVTSPVFVQFILFLCTRYIPINVVKFLLIEICSPDPTFSFQYGSTFT